MPGVSVVVAEDEEPVRAALSDLITGDEGLELVAAVGDVQAALEAVRMHEPAVALVDVRMPGGGGSEAAAGIAKLSPATRVIALSAYEDRATVLAMLRAGAIGYLVKGTSAAEVGDAIRRAARDQASLSGGLLRDLVEGIVEDSRHREEALDKLRRSEETYRGLLETAPDAVVIVNGDGRITLVNAETERMFGYRRQQMIGKPVEALLPERFHARHLDHRGGYMADPRTRPMGAGLELAARREDGTEFPVDISLGTLETEEGRLVTARVRDITERKHAEDVIRKSEKRFAALLESAPDAVVIIDQMGRIVLVNQQTQELFGYQREELLGRPVELLLPERFHERHVGHRSTYLGDPRTRPMGAGLELAGRRKDSTEFPVDISLSTIDTAEGRLMTAFVRDVSERHERAELERDLADRRALLAHMVAATEDERRRIAGDIHDDSIQAITAAGMRLQILRRNLEDPEVLARLDELESTIQLAITRLRHLLFELRPPVLDTEGLSAAIELYVDEMERTTNGRYTLEDRLHRQPLEDTRVILYRIAQEALTNVRKHADATKVAVELSERESGYLVRVSDDGSGFDVDGTGPAPGHLGLVSMRERAALAGGWARIDSEPGHGTTVEVWIPEGRD